MTPSRVLVLRLLPSLMAVAIGLSGSASAQQVFLPVSAGSNPGGTVAADGADILLGGQFQGPTQPVAAFHNLSFSSILQEPSGQTGYGTAISLKAGIAVVGSDGTSSEPGSVFIYTSAGTGAWNLGPQLIAPDGQPGDAFGATVDIDGELLIVGAPEADAPATNSGAAYMFGLHGGAWALESKLVPPGIEAGSRAGTAVAVSGDLAVVLSPNLSVGGRVDIWKRSGVFPFVSWEYRTTITGNMYGIGTLSRGLDFRPPRMAIGGTNATGGLVAIFEQSSPTSGTWTLEATVVPLDADGGDGFGTSVALCDAGLWVGAPDKCYAGSCAMGAAYLFGTTGDGAWLQLQKALPFNLPASCQFGRSIAVFSDSTDKVLIGAPGAHGAYVLPASPPPAIYCQAKLNSYNCLPAIAFVGTPAYSNQSGFTVSASNMISNTSGILFWGLLQNNVPFAGGTLCVSPPLRRTPVQFSGGNPPPNDCSGMYSYHFTPAYLSSNFPIGTTVFAQYYSRDNGFAIPNNVGLTDAVRFTVLP